MKLFKLMKEYKVYLRIMLVGIGMYLLAVLPVINIHYNLTAFLINDGFNNFLVAIGTGIFASALTALLIDRSHKKEQDKNSLHMKKQILYDILLQLNFWVKKEDNVEKFELKLNVEYLNEQIEECNRAVNFCIPYLSDEEYFALSTIERQLKEMQQVVRELKENERYKKYENAYERLLYDEAVKGNFFQTFECEQEIVNLYGLDNRTANDIALSVIGFKGSMELIANNLTKFNYLEIDEF